MLDTIKLYNEVCRLDGLSVLCTDEKLLHITLGVQRLYEALYNNNSIAISDAGKILNKTITKYCVIEEPKSWGCCMKSSIQKVIKLIESLNGVRLIEYQLDVYDSSIGSWIDVLTEYVQKINENGVLYHSK